MEKEVPKVNFMLEYVNCLKGLDSKSEYAKKYFDKRQFYACEKDFDYVKYVNSGSKEKLDYVQYSGNEEKSDGIFDKDGLLSKEQIAWLRDCLRNTKSTIWHGVISFEKDFGDTYVKDTNIALKLLNRVLPKFFKKAGLEPSNIEWYAGLHENTDNKHIHISFFEKSPLRVKRDSNKKYFSDGLIDKNAINSLKISTELLLLQSSKDVLAGRKTLTDSFKSKLNQGEFMKLIKIALESIPFEHRISYDSENIKPYQKKVDLISEAIINSNKTLQKKFTTFIELLIKRDNEIARAYKNINIPYESKLVAKKYIADIYRRLGNIVLYKLKEIRNLQKEEERETKSRLIQKRIEKRKKKILLKECIDLNDMVNREIIDSFKEYIKTLEEVNYKRLKEEGYLD